MKNYQPLILILFQVLFISSLTAQQTISLKNNCGFSRKVKERKVVLQPASKSISSIADQITTHTKLPINFSIHVYDGLRPLAVEAEGQRYLLLEKDFEKRLGPNYPQRWVHLGALAFVAGRLMLKHDLANTNADQNEQDILAADRFAGICLRMQGASFKETIEVYSSPSLPEENLPGYPPFSARKQSNQLGWESKEYEMRTTVLASDDQKPQELADCAICPDMVFLRGGTFKMGNSKGEPNEQPEHSVTLSGFWIGKTELSSEQMQLYSQQLKEEEEAAARDSFKALYSEKGAWSFHGGWSSYKHFDKYSRGDLRREAVGESWTGANDYCKYLTKKTGKKFRLPTEAEWEYAARSGALQDNFIYSGSNDILAVAWSSLDKVKRQQAIGSKQPNSVGLFDMSGNLSEWCADCYTDNYIGAPSDGRPIDPEKCNLHVARGGHWQSSPEQMRVTARTPKPGNVGFRVVMEQ